MSIPRENLDNHLRDINSLLEKYQDNLIAGFLVQLLPKQTLAGKGEAPSLGLTVLLEPDKDELSPLAIDQLQELLGKFLNSEVVRAIEPSDQKDAVIASVKQQIMQAIADYISVKKGEHIDPEKGSDKYAAYIQQLENVLAQLPAMIDEFVEDQLLSDPVLQQMVEAKAKVKSELIQALELERQERIQLAMLEQDKAIKDIYNEFDYNLQQVISEASNLYPRTPHDSSPILAPDAKEREAKFKVFIAERELGFAGLRDAEIENANYEYVNKIANIEREFQQKMNLLDGIKAVDPSVAGSSLDRTIPGELPLIEPVRPDIKSTSLPGRSGASHSWGSTIPAEGFPGIAGVSTGTAAAEAPRRTHIDGPIDAREAARLAGGLDGVSSRGSTPPSSPLVVPASGVPRPSRLEPLADRPPSAATTPPPHAPVPGVNPPSPRPGTPLNRLNPIVARPTTPSSDSDGSDRGPSRPGSGGR
jgi:hypothetical protein